MKFNIVRIYLKTKAARTTARSLTLKGAKRRIHSPNAKGTDAKRGPWIEGYRVAS